MLPLLDEPEDPEDPAVVAVVPEPPLLPWLWPLAVSWSLPVLDDDDDPLPVELCELWRFLRQSENSSENFLKRSCRQLL